MVDSLQIAAAVIVVFVLALAVEILFACCRVYAWIRRSFTDPRVVPPGKYRRGSISHNWSDDTLVQNSVFSPTASPSTKVPQDIRKRHDDANQDDTTRGRSRDTNHHGPPDDRNSEDAREYRRERRRSSSVRPNRMLFSNDFTRSLPHDWQSGQFACANCATSLTGQRYILHDDRPFCKVCYETLFANECDKCKQKITCDYRDLSYKDKHWHDKCFACSTCGVSLTESPFAYKFDRLHCATCYENNFAPRCTLCGAIFRAGMKKYEHKGRQWHAECFTCRVCQKQIGTSSFIPRGDEVICVPCYERQYGQQCTKCGGSISKSGVMFAGRPWHRECFQCSHCHTQIGRDKFTTIKDAPYCVLCYGFLFAKKCYACSKPITGVEDCKFIAFDGRQWHCACFQCVRCEKSLLGRGFLTDGDDVMCPDCCRVD